MTSTKQGWTAGEWHYSEGHTPHYQGQVYGETGATIAVTYHDEGGGNAALIAAAPAMYEALEATARHLVIDHKFACESDTYERGEYHVSKCDCHLNRRWREVEAALKLARGGRDES